jgi:hypothetical protein
VLGILHGGGQDATRREQPAEEQPEKKRTNCSDHGVLLSGSDGAMQGMRGAPNALVIGGSGGGWVGLRGLRGLLDLCFLYYWRGFLGIAWPHALSLFLGAAADVGRNCGVLSGECSAAACAEARARRLRTFPRLISTSITHCRASLGSR